MKPVYQKLICGKHGDCVPACLASILEIDERGIVKLKIVHDPNPKNEPYPDDVEILGVEFIVKM